VLEAEASVHAVAENALDVPHTSFLHGGLFRVDADRNEITARISRHWDRVECEYIGEARPKGLAARILSPSGGLVTHFDRFYLPSVVEVEYQIGDENHILVNAALTPTRDHHTIVNAVVSIRARVPLWLIRPFAESAALKIFAQDQAVLLRQTESLRRFGDARFVSTELDLLGPHILRLMGQAAKGSLEEPTGTPYVKQIQMKV
jgi:phenylpropionate dioxygenase-like ring-hydroxylating dioxygenase large terminal subunit